MTRALILLVALAVAMVSTACGGESGAEREQTVTVDHAGGPQIVIEDPWSRSTPDVEGGTGIVYMTISNQGDTADRLVAAKTPMAAAVELHIDEVDANGVMHMRMVDGGVIDILPGETVRLEPASLHIMLVGLVEPLEEGASYPLTLKFESVGEITLVVPVAYEQPAPGSAEPIIVPET
ncbi:MAG: copper chaperone PCu(A)C [Acidimicrobiia bacterium]